jgi:hypothetical protein
MLEWSSANSQGPSLTSSSCNMSIAFWHKGASGDSRGTHPIEAIAVKEV